ncbi:hypothetical protein CN425_19005 [Bacillus cereus]|uniref:Signal peptidase II n=1 Tax=Bacillus cereus TaxID=1396 RepID=A0A2A8PSY2_BACCE|nr:hypothetical protein [Bacillus cereus]PEA06997.1 hypothetical protein CON38_24965 [Bacillus cereus]PEV99564.1 hypothetical protein CN425_19005 [Bacillus cereus]
MKNKKPFLKMKVWYIQVAMLLFFAISAIALSNGVVQVQTIVKEHLLKKQKQYPPNYNPIEEEEEGEHEGTLDKEAEPVYEPTKKLKHKIKIIEKKDKDNFILSVLANPWVQITCYVVIGGVIVFVIYTFIRKKNRKKVGNEQTDTDQKPHVDHIQVKHKKVQQPSSLSLPTDPVRRKLIEWEQSLPVHEKRRPYESIQMWLDRICRSRGIIPIYESVRYGNQSATELDIEKTVQWIKVNK